MKKIIKIDLSQIDVVKVAGVRCYYIHIPAVHADYCESNYDSWNVCDCHCRLNEKITFVIRHKKKRTLVKGFFCHNTYELQPCLAQRVKLDKLISVKTARDVHFETKGIVMYVLECLGLYIKEGGFTEKEAEAKKYRTIKDAKKDQVRGWIIKQVSKDE